MNCYGPFISAKPTTDDKLNTFVGHDAALPSRPAISFTRATIQHRIATRGMRSRVQPFGGYHTHLLRNIIHYFRFAVAVRSILPAMMNAWPHQFEPNPLLLVGVKSRVNLAV